jgi:multidrug efflux pump subunit AcrB
MGALYVNDFNKAGRVYRVQLQAEADYRMKPEDHRQSLCAQQRPAT